jgi:RHS repeat-associated protein
MALPEDRYDAEGRVIETWRLRDGREHCIRFEYDADGHRVARRTSIRSPDGALIEEATRRVVIDPLTPGRQPKPVAEATPGGELKRVFLEAARTVCEVSPADGGRLTVNYLVHDGHGSTRGAAPPGTESGATAAFDYDAFGNLLGSPSPDPGVQRLFSGEAWDPVLGLQPLEARDYDPAAGRFRQRDTFEGVPESPSTQQGYAYADDDPVNRVDPSGHSSIAETLSAESLAQTVQTGLGHLGTAVRVYQKVDAVMEVYQTVSLAGRLTQAFLQSSPEGVEAAIAAELARTLERVELAELTRGLAAALRTVGPRWPEIAEAIAEKAPTIAAEATVAAAQALPKFSDAMARGTGRYVLYLPTGPGSRTGLCGEGSDTYIPVGRKLMVAAGISGGRLFGFGIRDSQHATGFNPQLFRIDYYDARRSNPLHVHYHVMNDRRHERIWEP